MLPLLAFLVAAPAIAGSPPGPNAKGPSVAQVFRTTQGTGERLAAVATLALSAQPQPQETQVTVLVDPSKQFQEIVGIGGALTDASAETLAALPEEQQAEVVRSFFDPKQGIGYSLARTHIHSCDFSSESYTYVRDGDARLASFDIAHDRKHRLPLLRRAIAAAGGTLTVFVSPWSPPGWMKDNGSMLHGGKLKAEYRAAWADYFVKFIAAYEKEGVPIWGLTVQNEPLASQTWESCIFTAEEERDFLKGYLGPALAKAGYGGKKVMVWDHNRDLLYQRASAVFDDPEAAQYAWGVAYHWYETWAGGQPLHEAVRRVHEAWPGKPLFFSEGCVCPDDEKRTLHLGDWALGEKYGREMIADFNAGTVAWTDWNVLLDERGGPNHVGNFCYAPLHVDTKSKSLTYTSIYWYLGHFSKFVRPGARRVAALSTQTALAATAFRNTDGGLAVVVMNPGDKPVSYTFSVQGRGAATVAPAHSIATLVVR
jgi:glucosylceramidase